MAGRRRHPGRQCRLYPVASEWFGATRGELRKVAWPTRAEVVNYSIIVLVAIILLTAYVAFLDYGFGDVLLNLFSR